MCYSDAMSLFIPVTRAWSRERVIAAFDASDIPKRVILLLDAPGTWDWVDDFKARGWDVTTVVTHHSSPPADRLARRPRHLVMRRMSQFVTQDCGRILYSEDDTLVPPDVWTRLNALLDRGYTAASGVQHGRYDHPYPGVWRWNREAGIMDVFEPVGVEEADAVGHYCFLTTGAAYAAASINPHPDEPIDCAHTRQFAPIAVDGDVRCGHLLESGEVLD
jgi:hypothetical protein